MRVGILAVFFIWSLSSFASEEVWKPELNFSIENGSYTETLYFISGVGDTLNLVNQLLLLEGMNNSYCMPKNKIIESKYIVEVLNRFPEKELSAVLAVSIVLTELRKQFPCE